MSFYLTLKENLKNEKNNIILNRNEFSNFL